MLEVVDVALEVPNLVLDVRVVSVEVPDPCSSLRREVARGPGSQATNEFVLGHIAVAGLASHVCKALVTASSVSGVAGAPRNL